MARANGTIRWVVGLSGLALWLLGCAVVLNGPRSTAPTLVTVRREAPRPVAERVVVVGGPRLPHATHLDLGLACADCHEVNEDTGNPGYPELEFCQDCHEEMEEDEEVPAEQRVAQVFFTPDEGPRWQRALVGYDAEIRFSHAPHAEQECATCHGSMETTQRVRRLVKSMADCMACHQQSGAANTCAVCHEQIRDTVPPPSHTDAAAWETGHGPLLRGLDARGEDSTCHYCHTQESFCNDCHTGRLPSSHRGNWEGAHGNLVLRSGGIAEAGCTFCHQQTSFCDSCHLHEAPSSHRHLWEERHGAFVKAQGISGQARCAFCHHEPSFCEDCHDDHEPRDHTSLFRTRTHGLMAAIDRERCQTCHETDFCVRCHEDTAPRSHRGMWARGRTNHCVQCHFPITSEPSCRVCHHENPTHDTAPGQPASHLPGLNCRICHNATGFGGAPPLRHVDNGMNCEICHPN